LDGDGLADLLLSGFELTVAWGGAAPAWSDQSVYYVDGSSTILLEDFDDDGADDLALIAEMIPSASRVLDLPGCANAGAWLYPLLLEASGGSSADIANLPAWRIVSDRLCDGPTWDGTKTDEALLAEARGARLPAGTGVLPLFDYLDALPPDCEIEYEVARGDMMDRPAVDKARAAAADVERFMARYGLERQSRTVGGARA
jgi:hypothetical protein